MNSRFTFCDLFAGIGGFRVALEGLGGRCVYSVECDNFARAVYEANWGPVGAQDVRYATCPQVDVLTAGPPCQPFSQVGVGKRRSLGMPSGMDADADLWAALLRCIDDARPRAVLLENVPRLARLGGGRTLGWILSELTDRGYHSQWALSNADRYVPQNRTRLFLVGLRTDLHRMHHTMNRIGLAPDLQLANLPPDGPRRTLADCLDDDSEDHCWLTQEQLDAAERHRQKQRARGNHFGMRVVDPQQETTCPTLTAHMAKSPDWAFNLPRGVRPPTVVETRRLMGFPSGFKLPVSRFQALRLLGNSVVPPQVAAITRRILWALDRSRGAETTATSLPT